MKTDIQSKEDIVRLINTFYARVKVNGLIGHIFTEIAQLDWDHHLPVMYDFWESVLFHTGPYNRNPMIVHKDLHAKYPLNREHFAEWLRLFRETVDELFEGTNAMIIKQRAESIATVMQLKILQSGAPEIKPK